MANQPEEEQDLDTDSDLWVHEIWSGSVRAAVYRDACRKEETSYWVGFDRLTIRGRRENFAWSFCPGEMADVAWAAEAVYRWILDNTDCVPAPVIPVFETLCVDVGLSPIQQVTVGNVLAWVSPIICETGKLHEEVRFFRGKLDGRRIRFLAMFRPEDLPQVAQAALHCREWSRVEGSLSFDGTVGE